MSYPPRSPFVNEGLIFPAAGSAHGRPSAVACNSGELSPLRRATSPKFMVPEAPYD